MNMFKDKDGNWSSKRIIGFVIIMNALALDNFGAVYSALVGMADSSTFALLVNNMLIVGGSLLGVGVLEGIKKTIIKDNK